MIEVRDKQLQNLISVTLRTGVLVAVILGVLGGVIFLTVHGTDATSFHTFVGDKLPYASPLNTVHEALRPQSMDAGVNRGLAIAQIGIICLLLTPIVRVALSIVGFALEKDAIYVVITAVVLATLTCSMLLH